MAKQLINSDLLSLEQYDKQRSDWRQKINTIKKLRRIAIGPHVTLHFENRLTMQYQVQEMLYAEKIYSEQGIQDELDVYNSLIPDGDNWKMTMMIEYADAEVRRIELQKLVGIEDRVYVRVIGFDSIYAFANEDLDIKTSDKVADKTSAVHFLRLPLTGDVIDALQQGAEFQFGINHPQYQFKSGELAQDSIHSLLEDLTQLS